MSQGFIERACVECGAPIAPTGKRGRPRKWSLDCLPAASDPAYLRRYLELNPEKARRYQLRAVRMPTATAGPPSIALAEMAEQIGAPVEWVEAQATEHDLSKWGEDRANGRISPVFREWLSAQWELGR